MKTITFEGKQYEVEDWVKWVAMDESGYVFCYEKKPRRHKNGWYKSKKNRVIKIDCYDWPGSLTEV